MNGSANRRRGRRWPRGAASTPYIDESGDEGFTRIGWRARGVQEASSEWLLLGAVLMFEEKDGEHTRVVDRLRDVVGRTKSKKPRHWRDLRNDHAKKRRAMDLLAAEGPIFSAVALSKRHLEGRAPALQGKKGYLYNWAARLLIERLSWFATKGGRRLNPAVREPCHDPVQRPRGVRPGDPGRPSVQVGAVLGVIRTSHAVRS